MSFTWNGCRIRANGIPRSLKRAEFRLFRQSAAVGDYLASTISYQGVFGVYQEYVILNDKKPGRRISHIIPQLAQMSVDRLIGRIRSQFILFSFRSLLVCSASCFSWSFFLRYLVFSVLCFLSLLAHGIFFFSHMCLCWFCLLRAMITTYFC